MFSLPAFFIDLSFTPAALMDKHGQKLVYFYILFPSIFFFQYVYIFVLFYLFIIIFKWVLSFLYYYYYSFFMCNYQEQSKQDFLVNYLMDLAVVFPNTFI